MYLYAFIKGNSASGISISGRIASGFVCNNDKILICPTKEQCVVKNILIDELPVQTAFAGDQVTLVLSGTFQNLFLNYAINN